MMISAQTISMSASRISQPGIRKNSPVSLSPCGRRASLNWSSSRGFQKRRGYSTLAIKQASSVFSSAGDASDDAVPAKDTGVRDFTAGTNTMELIDSTSLAKLASIDDQLPSLLSMVIDGFPSLQQSKYIHEAEKCLQQYIECYPNVISLDSYCRVGLSSASYWHPGVINIDCLVAMSFNYALLVLLDDLFFYTPNEFLQDQYGISHSACESPEKIQEYFNHLNGIFSQQEQACNHAPLIETMMWESGRDMLELSNLEWFRNYIKCIEKQQRVCIPSHAYVAQGHKLWFQDLEIYTVMRAENAGANIPQLVIEFANDIYISSTLRANPYFENVTTTTTIHIAFTNDVFSYYKESSLEQNPYNLITVLMECEGKPFVQTLHIAIGLVNSYARAIMDLEAKAWNSTLQNHLQDIKAFIAGNVYFSFMDKRY